MIGYVTLEEAKEFLKKRYNIEELEDTELIRCLYRALDKIESLCIRNSGKSEEQELIFPRLCEKKVPQDIKIAQILEGYSLAANDDDESVSDQEKGIGSRSISDMSVSYTGDGSNRIGNTFFANIQAKDILFRYVRKTYDWT